MGKYIRRKKGKLCIMIVSMIFILIGTLSPINKVTAASDTDSIDWLIKQGILTDDFNVKEIKKDTSKFITREEFISLIILAAGETEKDSEQKELQYVDAKQVDNKLVKYIKRANALNITQQITMSLRPQKALTKQMAAYYLGRYFHLDMDLPLEEYEDFDDCDKTCKLYVAALVKYGVMQGETDKRFEPFKKLTWKQVGEMFQRLDQDGWFTEATVKVLIGRDQDVNENKIRELYGVSGICQDTKRGIIYLTDSYHNQIKAIENGKVSVVAGQDLGRDEVGKTIGGYADGPCDKALFHNPTGIKLTENGIYVVDTGNNAIRFIDLTNHLVSTIAGDGEQGAIDGKSKEARFNHPQDIAVAADGTLYIADTGNSCIRMISKSGEVTTLTGAHEREGYQDGSLSIASFHTPTGIAIADSGIYVVDCGNQRIRKICDGMVTTYAGMSNEKDINTDEWIGGFQNGAVSKAMFCYPTQIAVDSNGSIYIGDKGNGMIRRIKDDQVTTVAGFGSPVTQKNFQWEDYLISPSSLIISPKEDSIYVVDSFLNLVVEIKTK